MNLAIYAAQGYALGTFQAIKTLYSKREICCIFVTGMDTNAPVLGGIFVNELASFAKGVSVEEKQNTEILIALPIRWGGLLRCACDKSGR